MDIHLNRRQNAGINPPRNNRGVQVNNNPTPTLIPDDYDDNMTDDQKVVRITNKLHHERAVHRDTINELNNTIMDITLNHADVTEKFVRTSIELSETKRKLSNTQDVLTQFKPFKERLRIQTNITRLIAEKHNTLNDDFYTSLPKDAKNLKDIVHTANTDQKEKIQSLLTSLSMDALNVIKAHLNEYEPDIKAQTKKQKTDNI